MATLVPRDLGWIDDARVTVSASASTSATPDAVFAVLADHERWPEWFPSVRKVEVLGPAEGVGARRRVTVPGLVVDETFIAWDPGSRWSFTGTSAKPGLFTSLIEDAQLTARPGGGTDVTYTMHFDPRPGVGPLVKVGAGVLRGTIAKALGNLAARAEGRS